MALFWCLASPIHSLPEPLMPGGRDKESASQCRRCGFNPPGEGNGGPLQYSCLEDSMDRGFQGATVHGVTKSQIQLKRTKQQQSFLLESSNSRPCPLSAVRFQQLACCAL